MGFVDDATVLASDFSCAFDIEGCTIVILVDGTRHRIDKGFDKEFLWLLSVSLKFFFMRFESYQSSIGCQSGVLYSRLVVNWSGSIGRSG